MAFRKDESLDRLARDGNVAQFVSFRPEQDGQPKQEYCRVAGYVENFAFSSVLASVEALLANSADNTVNVRSFTPESPQSRDFHYGIGAPGDVEALVRALVADGLFVIVNETVDVRDGGVSGVIQGGVIEFAPDDTPRCVEKPGTASLPLDVGLELLGHVYGFRPAVPTVGTGRIEFSIHPKRRGWKQTHTLLWEHESATISPSAASIRWPNHFSRHIGDKLYGLLVGHIVGLPIPKTQVVARRVKPFVFGQSTGIGEVWTRTCPIEQEPGRFTTSKGWLDPFRIMSDEDPHGNLIASVLCQAAVDARWSGAALTDGNGASVIEGIEGEGDAFMLGRRAPERLPIEIEDEVRQLFARATDQLGDVRFEWVHDGKRAWIVQLHVGRSVTTADIVVPGEPECWQEFEVVKGLEALRLLLKEMSPNDGVSLVGEFGLTSHIADILRKANRPARIARTPQTQG